MQPIQKLEHCIIIVVWTNEKQAVDDATLLLAGLKVSVISLEITIAIYEAVTPLTMVERLHSPGGNKGKWNLLAYY